MKTKYYLILGPIILFVIWEFVSVFNFVNVFFLPTPHSVFIELLKLLTNHETIIDIFATIIRFITALFFGIIVGVPTGILLGSTVKIYKSSEFLIDFFRSIPATAMFPLFLLIFGIGDSAKIGVTVFAISLIVIFNTANAIMYTKKTRVLAVKLMGATKFQIFRLVLFWECLPQIVTGIRTASSIGLAIIIVTEMFIGTSSGIGKRIIDFQYIYNLKGVYAMIIIAGIIGFLINLLFSKLENKLIHWSGK